MTAPTTTSPDHRARVGAERRARMRAHLLQSALPVFAERGLEANIGDIIAAAEVSRGTFYNYFRTTEQVVVAVGDALGHELLALIEGATTSHFEDPAVQVGVGLQLFLSVVQSHPHFGAFLWRTAFGAEATTRLLETQLPRDIGAGIDSGAFAIADPTVGYHAVAGVMLTATFALSTMDTPDDYPGQMIRSALMALGASEALIEQVLALELPQLHFSPDSLVGRTQQA